MLHKDSVSSANSGDFSELNAPQKVGPLGTLAAMASTLAVATFSTGCIGGRETARDRYFAAREITIKALPGDGSIINSTVPQHTVFGVDSGISLPTSIRLSERDTKQD